MCKTWCLYKRNRVVKKGIFTGRPRKTSKHQDRKLIAIFLEKYPPTNKWVETGIDVTERQEIFRMKRNLHREKSNENQQYDASKVSCRGSPEGSLSIASTPRCRGGRYSFPWIAPLYPLSVPFFFFFFFFFFIIHPAPGWILILRLRSLISK